MRILLVGAGGFVGRHLLPALLAAGHELLLTARRPPVDAPAGVRWLALDLERLAERPDSFAWPAGVDLLINAAGTMSLDEASMARVQDSGARALFDLAAAHGAKVLQISALGAGAHPDVAFLASKAAADRHLLELGIPALVLALLRCWPERAQVIPLVGPQALTQGELLDELRRAQGWPRGRYVVPPAALLDALGGLGRRAGWRTLSPSMLKLVRHDNLADPALLDAACGYRCAPLASRLLGWPQAARSLAALMRPLMLAALVLIWLGTLVACLGPGYGWGLRILGEAGIHGWPASLAVIAGALLDGALGVGLLLRRWRRRALLAQFWLMLGYSLAISLILPHYWYDPYMAVGKNIVLMVATLWLLGDEPRAREARG
ncbi:SDR family oxidoreductase [Pseudomonas aeruginosa]|uniref:SDR family oxidoreductase n=1 Tax=Pseudomonas aeruginosa TaxID=287 RepID=UPI00249CEA62|nr:SDR family oxidoreductase [Pseudomonas aeruginosa]EIU1321920.1 SDR family oxidoreductase [Pseudomonas aeruginosa]WGX42978.1 SDR family oxidoreductase [Pseudomonas aeruginosa]